MATEVKINMMKELRLASLQLKTALYNISLATELSENGQPVEDMSALKEELKEALSTAYHFMDPISLNTYCFIYNCYLNENES